MEAHSEQLTRTYNITIEWERLESSSRKLDTIKAVLRGKFIAIQAYLKKQEKGQINNLTLHLKQLEKEEMKNPRVCRRKENLKIRAEISAKKPNKQTKETIPKEGSL